MNFIWEDLKFFVTCLKNLSVSESLMLDNDKGFCVSTGCDLDSWVFYPEHVNDSGIVKEAMNFFNSREISFIFPVYDSDEEHKKIFEDCGLFLLDTYTAMVFESGKILHPETNSLITIKHVKSSESSREWADTSWRGFGGLDDVPENYYRFVEAMSDDRENLSLYTAEYNGMNAGTFIITNEENYTGVYYFATVPEMRRKGIARSMMNGICRLSAGKDIVLHATTEGLPFYKNFGFKELFTIPIYSNEKES